MQKNYCFDALVQIASLAVEMMSSEIKSIFRMYVEEN